jgi:hypothetical protein
MKLTLRFSKFLALPAIQLPVQKGVAGALG